MSLMFNEEMINLINNIDSNIMSLKNKKELFKIPMQKILTTVVSNNLNNIIEDLSQFPVLYQVGDLSTKIHVFDNNTMVKNTLSKYKDQQLQYSEYPNSLLINYLEFFLNNKNSNYLSFILNNNNIDLKYDPILFWKLFHFFKENNSLNKFLIDVPVDNKKYYLSWLVGKIYKSKIGFDPKLKNNVFSENISHIILFLNEELSINKNHLDNYYLPKNIQDKTLPYLI